MARVLQRRPTAPPYLLIAFVFLFLVAATLAVLFYTRQEDARKLAAQEQAKREKLAARLDEAKAYVKGRIAEGPPPDRPDPPPPVGQLGPSEEAKWAKKPTVVTRLNEHLATLSQLVDPKLTGSQGDAIGLFLEAAKELNETQAKVKAWKAIEVLDSERLSEEPTTSPTKSTEWAGVMKEFQTAYEDKFKKQIEVCRILKKEVEVLKKVLDSKEVDLAKVRSELESLQGALEKQAGELTAAKEETNDLKGKLESALSVSEDRKGKLDAQTDLGVKQRLEITALQRKVDDLDGKLRRKEMEAKFERMRRKRIALTTPPDGKIVGVTPNQNLCSIDRGLRDGIEVGHTFGVFPKTGIPENLQPKGKITVIRAEDTVSECRITEENEKNPIERDDIIANLVLDANRKYKFVIAGEFDLYNKGYSTPVDKQEVILLIRRFGGEIVEKLDINVDYAVMGDPPRLPETGDALAGPVEDPARIRAQKEAREHYDRIKAEAQKYGVQILNQNRFLDLVGYVPKKTLTQ